MRRAFVILLPVLLTACGPVPPETAGPAEPAVGRGPSCALTIYSVPDEKKTVNEKDLFWIVVEDEERTHVIEFNEDGSPMPSKSLAAKPGIVATQMKNFADMQATCAVYNPSSVSLEPYGFGIVQEERDVEFQKGLGEFRYTDVARFIRPDTVRLKCLSSPGAVHVVEQNFEYDVVTADALLEKYLGREVTAVMHDGSNIVGRLLTAGEYENELAIDTPQGIAFIRSIPEQDCRDELYWDTQQIRFSELPGGFVTKPTLAWLIDSQKEGKERIRVSYRTRGLMWEAAYTALISPDEKSLGLSGAATIGNASGKGYEDARLKLVAGNVNLTEKMEPVNPFGMGGLGGCSIVMAEPEYKFVEKPFFEYHLYSLGRPCTVRQNEVKQIELFPPVKSVPMRKKYIYRGILWDRDQDYSDLHGDYSPTCNTKVDVYAVFKNDEKAGLGIPLPAGPMRFMKIDPADGQPELVGEGRIEHTPKDEEVVARLGSAFDITGNRVRTNFEDNYDEQHIRESFEITLRNHKTEPVDIEVREVMYRWVNWQIVESSHTPALKVERLPEKPVEPAKLQEWEKFVLEKTGDFTFNVDLVDIPEREIDERLTEIFNVPVNVEQVLQNDGRDKISLHAEGLRANEIIRKIVENVPCRFAIDPERGAVIAYLSTVLVEREYSVPLFISAYRVVELIERTIAPSTWGDYEGGEVHVLDDDVETNFMLYGPQPPSNIIFVKNAPEVQDMVANLLAQLAQGREAQNVSFHITVPANGQEKITYTVRYTW